MEPGGGSAGKGAAEALRVTAGEKGAAVEPGGGRVAEALRVAAVENGSEAAEVEDAEVQSEDAATGINVPSRETSAEGELSALSAAVGVGGAVDNALPLLSREEEEVIVAVEEVEALEEVKALEAAMSDLGSDGAARAEGLLCALALPPPLRKALNALESLAETEAEREGAELLLLEGKAEVLLLARGLEDSRADAEPVGETVAEALECAEPEAVPEAASEAAEAREARGEGEEESGSEARWEALAEGERED